MRRCDVAYRWAHDLAHRTRSRFVLVRLHESIDPAPTDFFSRFRKGPALRRLREQPTTSSSGHIRNGTASSSWIDDHWGRRPLLETFPVHRRSPLCSAAAKWSPENRIAGMPEPASGAAWWSHMAPRSARSAPKGKAGRFAGQLEGFLLADGLRAFRLTRQGAPIPRVGNGHQ